LIIKIGHEDENMIKKTIERFLNDHDHKMAFTTPQKIHKYIVAHVTQTHVACK
jgi:hypothetical protein